MPRVHPAPSAKTAAARAREFPGRAAAGRHDIRPARHVLVDCVNDFRAGVRRRLFVANRPRSRCEHEGRPVGRPAKAADVLVVACYSHFPSIGHRPHNDVACPEERDARSIWRWHDRGFRRRRRPHRGRSATVDRHSPEIAVLREHECAAIGAPERTAQLSAGGAELPRGCGQSAAYGGISDVNLRDAGTLPYEHDVAAIRRPHRRRRMPDVDELLDSERACGVNDQRRCQHERSQDECHECFHSDAVYREAVSHGVTSPNTLHPTFRTIGQTSRRRSKSPWQAVGPLVQSGRLRDLPDDATTTKFPFWRKYMSRMLRFLAASIALTIAAPAAAQVQTGSILVRAVDDQGAVVPGVSVTITSSVLVAGTMTGVTDAGGVFRFPSLVPGTYGVKMELTGFQTINRENIAVLVGQTTPIDFSMKVASIAESITVTSASPAVDTTSATLSVTLSEQLIQGTPGGRDIWALVEAKVPGLVISRPDVGGTSGGLQGTFSARGTTSAQNKIGRAHV